MLAGARAAPKSSPTMTTTLEPRRDVEEAPR
jgi:hypothetical protein